MTNCTLLHRSSSIHSQIIYKNQLDYSKTPQLVSEYCIDLDSIHHTGISNGGEFGYQVAAYMDRCRPTTSPIINNIEMLFIIKKHGTPIIRFATIGPWAAAPFLGYAAVPDRAFSMIDFHGTMDDTIPYDLTPPFGVGSGPDGTVLSWDGYRYYDKPRVIRTWAEGLECGPAVSAPSFSPPLLISSPRSPGRPPWTMCRTSSAWCTRGAAAAGRWSTARGGTDMTTPSDPTGGCKAWRTNPFPGFPVPVCREFLFLSPLIGQKK